MCSPIASRLGLQAKILRKISLAKELIWYNRPMDTRRVELSFSVRKPILACGADLKGAFALAKDRVVFLYEGFGDLSDLDNFERYEASVKRAIKTTGIKPAIIACDMHPGYFSTRFAESFLPTTNGQRPTTRAGSLFSVQHHEAHIASCMIDNDLKGSVIAVAFDGTGYGPDGNIWGGEFFVGGLKSFKRAAHLEYVSMPGADAAVREPWRMAESYLYKAYGKSYLKNFKKRGLTPLFKMIDKGINSPLNSSAGRLFDAAASLVLGRRKAGFEAELPIALEKIAAANCEDRYSGVTKPEDSPRIIKCIAADIRKGTDNKIISARFHNTVAGMINRTVGLLGKRYNIDRVVLSGGVFQNKYLTDKVIKYMKKSGFKVYGHKNLSTTDSSLPVGQIAIAQARRICV